MSVEATRPQADGAFSGYARPEERPPFASFAALTAIFNAGFAGALLAARWRGRELPERVGAGDVVLIGTASHKLSRLIARRGFGAAACAARSAS